jgi:hypothetical protein
MTMFLSPKRASCHADLVLIDLIIFFVTHFGELPVMETENALLNKQRIKF